MDFIKNLRVGTRLGLAFVVLLTLMLAMAGMGALMTKSINYYAEFYPDNILPSLRLIHRIDGAIGDARRLELQHIMAEDDKEKKTSSSSSSSSSTKKSSSKEKKTRKRRSDEAEEDGEAAGDHLAESKEDGSGDGDEDADGEALDIDDREALGE